jgi:hypothetical protein
VILQTSVWITSEHTGGDIEIIVKKDDINSFKHKYMHSMSVDEIVSDLAVKAFLSEHCMNFDDYIKIRRIQELDDYRLMQRDYDTWLIKYNARYK